MHTIQKLLNLAQSSNEHEAALAMEKVQELYEKYNIEKIKFDNNMKLPVQEESYEVKPQVQRPDQRALAWQQRNSWFGQDQEMTAAALGLHEKLKSNGVSVGSDEYYSVLDKTIRKRFSENFDEPVETRKSSNVVAPATRSTSSKKVRLSQTQAGFIKKLGITPEQYVREVLKLEN